MIAGKDTPANTLTWFFCMLCKHTFIQEKVALEVKEATGAEYTYSINEFSVKLTEATLDKMQYLHVALTETLRLYPPVPLVTHLCLLSFIEVTHGLHNGSFLVQVGLKWVKYFFVNFYYIFYK
ncbi:putative abieta-7,13-dien-18-ol hydroxylase [Helianthus annuus]|nr:putative abieta-7,13-dien-18-ol hydroxylase [Helianthus annuus]